MNKDPFDFDAFIANANNPSDSSREEILRDAVTDEMDVVMGEVAPRLWCVMQEQMMRDPKNNIHLNAVINASVFALLGWLVACTPDAADGTTTNDDILREKVLANLENAFKNARTNAAQMSQIAHSAGKLKLMNDACEGVATVLTANSQIIQGIHSTIKNMTPKA